MEFIEVVLDDQGCFVINLDKTKFTKVMSDEVTAMAKANNYTPEQIQAGIASLLKSSIKFGVIK